MSSFFFFFNDTATTEIYPLSLHDALPICQCCSIAFVIFFPCLFRKCAMQPAAPKNCSHCGRINPVPQAVKKLDRKSTRLNSSHSQISYAVFCLKKKKKI